MTPEFDANAAPEPFIPIKREPFYGNLKEGGFQTFTLEQLGEDGDPDLVQRNMVDIRNFNKAGVPAIFLYPIVAFFALTWKWMYYMPNTLKEYEKSQLDNKGKKN